MDVLFQGLKPMILSDIFIHKNKKIQHSFNTAEIFAFKGSQFSNLRFINQKSSKQEKRPLWGMVLDIFGLQVAQGTQGDPTMLLVSL